MKYQFLQYDICKNKNGMWPVLVLQSEKGSKVLINVIESSKSTVGGGGGVL
jgi:hypothetical protein